jgi:DNA-binding IclR family transcriptional regulator
MAPPTDNHSETMGPVRILEIVDLVDDSSLGTQGARDLRARTDPADIFAALNRSGVLDEVDVSPDEIAVHAQPAAVTPTSSATVGGLRGGTGLGSRRDPSSEPSDLIRSVSRGFQVLEAIGRSPRGLTVKQIARRCEFTVARTYRLVRTLVYEGYVNRREDGTYIVGLEVADRFQELVLAHRRPYQIAAILRTAATETGYTHLVGGFVGGRVAVTAIAEGVQSPRCEDLIVGFDDAPHATALGKALLATLNADQRWRFFKEHGLPAMTPQTLTSPEALDGDLIAGERRGLHVDIGQFHLGLASAAILAVADQEPEKRIAVACTVPPSELMASAKTIRAQLTTVAHTVADAIREASDE